MLRTVPSDAMMVEENTDPLDFHCDQKLCDLFDAQSTVSTSCGDPMSESMTSDFSDFGSRKSSNDAHFKSRRASNDDYFGWRRASNDSYVKPAQPSISAYDNAFGITGFSVLEESTPKAAPSWDQGFPVYAPVPVKDEKTPTTAATWDDAFAVHAPIIVTEEIAKKTASWESAFGVIGGAQCAASISLLGPDMMTASWDQAFGC
jgi:hypothetical protein